MAVQVQVVIDAANPSALAEFWAAAMGYQVQAPPPGFDSWPAFLAHVGVPEDQWDSKSAVVDPAGSGPRFFFQKVPEPKTVKNRVHVDLQPGAGHPPAERPDVVRAEVERLVGLGASVLRDVQEMGESWVVMADPEGNEFCVS